MRLDIYRDERLAATFVYGVAPRYYGHDGAEIAALIDTTPLVHNWWSGELHARAGGVGVDQAGADWWMSRIISAPLARAGFMLRPVWGWIEPHAARHA